MTGEPGARVVEDDLLLALIRKVEQVEAKLDHVLGPTPRVRRSSPRVVTVTHLPPQPGPPPVGAPVPTPVDPDDVRAQAMREEAEAIQAATGGRPDPGGPIPHEDTASWPVHDITDRGGFRE